MSGVIRAAPKNKRFESQAEFYRKSIYAAFDQDHRSGGTFGVAMMEVVQEPIDMIDSAVPDLVLCQNLLSGREVQLDFGEGLKRFERPSDPAICLVPAFTENRFKLRDAHRIRTFALRQTIVDAVLERHGVHIDAANPLVGQLSERRDLCGVLDELWCQMALPNETGSLMIDALTLTLLAKLTGSGCLSPAGDERRDARVARVVEYIEAHLGTPLSIIELAAIATMSAAHFSRCFKATIREPVWVYVQPEGALWRNAEGDTEGAGVSEPKRVVATCCDPQSGISWSA